MEFASPEAPVTMYTGRRWSLTPDLGLPIYRPKSADSPQRPPDDPSKRPQPVDPQRNREPTIRVR